MPYDNIMISKRFCLEQFQREDKVKDLCGESGENPELCCSREG